MIDELTFIERAAEALAVKRAEQEEISREQNRAQNERLKAKILDLLGIEVDPEDGEWRMAGLRFSLSGNSLVVSPVEPLDDGWLYNPPIWNWADVGWALSLINDSAREDEDAGLAWYRWLTLAEMNEQRAAGRTFAIVSADREADAVLVEYLDVEPADDDVAIGWDCAVAACQEERAELLAQLAEARGELEVARAHLAAAQGGYQPANEAIP